MGTLAGIGGQLGQYMAGAGTAGSLASRSLGWGALATGVDVAANTALGIEGFQQGQYRSDTLRQAAGDVRLAGQIEESASKARYTRLGAEQKVAQAANGIQVDSGSAEAVRDSTAAVGAMDAAMIHYNAMREAFGMDVEANLAKRAGRTALIQGAAGAGVSFLSGTRSLGDKWLQYKRNIGGPTYG